MKRLKSAPSRQINTHLSAFLFQISAVFLLLLPTYFAFTCPTILLPKWTGVTTTAAPPTTGSKSHVIVFNSESDEDEMETMRREIEEMRKEAVLRINTLSSRMPSMPITKTKTTTTEKRRRMDPRSRRERGISSSSSSSNSSSSSTAVMEPETKPKEEEKVAERRTAVSNARSVSEKSKSVAEKYSSTVGGKRRDDMELLHDTHWKIALNIGREPGTWMPKTWGISGDRLLLNLEICFDSKQLYEREEFLGSAGGAKICRVVNNELTLGPSMTEGSRKHRVRDGGWRIVKGDGPMGTDVLKFYFEIDAEISHRGGDVYCPAGRVYCTCGYFPMNRAPDGRKLELRRKLEELGNKYDHLQGEADKEGMFSFKKVKMTKDLFQISMDAQNVRKKLNEISVQDPDRSLLKFSRRRDVGLTKEGGVCCKVRKGATIEYHILGKFGLGAVDSKEE